MDLKPIFLDYLAVKPSKYEDNDLHKGIYWIPKLVVDSFSAISVTSRGGRIGLNILTAYKGIYGFVHLKSMNHRCICAIETAVAVSLIALCIFKHEIVGVIVDSYTLSKCVVNLITSLQEDEINKKEVAFTAAKIAVLTVSVTSFFVPPLKIPAKILKGTMEIAQVADVLITAKKFDKDILCEIWTDSFSCCMRIYDIYKALHQ